MNQAQQWAARLRAIKAEMPAPPHPHASITFDIAEPGWFTIRVHTPSGTVVHYVVDRTDLSQVLNNMAWAIDIFSGTSNGPID